MSYALFGNQDFRTCLSEFLATAFHVAIECFVCAFTDVHAMGAGLLAGTVIVAQMHIFGLVSGGHANPAVTSLSYKMGNYAFQACILVMLSQFLGGYAGFAAAKFITTDALVSVGDSSLSQANEIPLEQACIIEGVCTTIWLLCWCACWDCRNRGIAASCSIRMGFCKAGLTYLSTKFTGGSLNPARTVGVALYTQNFENFWPFYCTQMISGLIAMGIWKKVFPRYQCRLPNCVYCPQQCANTAHPRQITVNNSNM